MTRPRCLSRYSMHPDVADDPEIPAHAYEAARIELGAWASDEQVTQRALELMADSIDAMNANVDECEAESRLDDRNWEIT